MIHTMYKKYTQAGNLPKGGKGRSYPASIWLSQDNLEYLRLISRIEGVSMTEYVNQLLEVDKEEKSAVLGKARRVLKGVE